MKKFSLLSVFGLFLVGAALASCTPSNPNTITTHLVLTENGLYNGEEGELNETLFLENSIAYEAEAGSLLPQADVITNKISGVTFAGWITYKEGGVPSGVTKVSNEDNQIVYASWNHDGSNLPTGEGGSGGGNTDIPTGEVMRVYFKAPASWDEAYVYAWDSASTNLGAWPGVSMNKDSETGLFHYDYDTTRYTGVIFNNGNGIQTGDLVSPTSEDKDCYVYSTSTWMDEKDAILLEDTTPELPEGNYLFLSANHWLAANAWFAAYFFGGTNNPTWSKMEDINQDGIYECEFPTSYTSVIFCRMDPAKTALDWDSKWNQTADITIPTDGRNLFTVNNGAWDGATGSWSTYNS